MITVKGGLGSSVLTGITFSLENSIEEISFLIACDSQFAEICHTINNTKQNKNVTVDSIAEDVTTNLTFSIFFQSDSVNDIIDSTGTYFILKNVVVEIIP